MVKEGRMGKRPTKGALARVAGTHPCRPLGLRMPLRVKKVVGDLTFKRLLRVMSTVKVFAERFRWGRPAAHPPSLA